MRTLIQIKQGDAYDLTLDMTLGGQALNLAEVSAVEVMLDRGLRKFSTVSETGEGPVLTGDLGYDPASGLLRLPLSQQETFAFPGDKAIPVDLRVKLRGGAVLGARRMAYVLARESLSRSIL